MRPIARPVLAALAALAAWPAAGEVRLRTATLSPADGLDAAAFSALPDRPDLFAIAAAGRVGPELRRRLAAAGAEEVTYLPDDALAVWARPAALAALARDPAVGFVAPIPPAARVAPELRAAASERSLLLEVLLVPAVAPESAAPELSAVGLEVLGAGPGPRFNRIVGRWPAGRADALDRAAAVPGVFSLSRRPAYRLLNDTSIWVGQAGLQAPGTTPIFAAGIRGEGQVVAMIDTGCDVDMCYYQDPAGPPPTNTLGGTAFDPTRRKIIAYDFLYTGDDPADPRAFDNHGHGTHVAGSVGGDDLATPLAHDAGDGMAPAAQLVIQDGGYTGADDCADLIGLGCPVVDITPFFDQTWVQGARIHTNSWGDRENFTPQNTYTAACVDSDDFMWTHPDFLILYAAGNSGPGDDTVGSPSTAKNVIAVGATRRGSNADQLAGFSSRGWTDDGRIKPTVTCPGSGIVSADNDGDVRTANCGTVAMSGTSMASPTCAGLAALARQYFTAGYYPSGRPLPGDGFAPSAALVKATLINSARSMASETPIPSRDQGHGRVTLADTLVFPKGGRNLFVADEAAAFPAGSTAAMSYPVEVVSSSAPLKVTLVWTDYPSNPLAATHLVNDLDLTVSGPSGTFKGNVFTAGVSQTGGAYDRRNVEEQVLIAVPQPGTYTLEVRAVNVPQGPQGFALVATGDFPEPPGIVLDSATAAGDDLDPACTDGDGTPDNGELVRVRATVRNPGPVTATNGTVRLATSSPYLSILPPNPVSLAPVPPGATVTADFRLRVAAAPCRASADLTFEVTSVENLAPDTGSLTLTLEEDRIPASLRLGFENGLVDSSGNTWTASGGFATSTGRANGGATSLWAGVPPGAGHCDGSGSPDGGDACARLLSPPFTPAAGATFTLATWYQLEARSGNQFWDRANVHAVVGAAHPLISPASGRPYDGAQGDATALCHIDSQDGWAGTGGASWATSDFDLSAWAGRTIQVEVNYNTDGREICEGLYVDDLVLTGAIIPACDATTCSTTCSLTALQAMVGLEGVKGAGLAADFRWADPGSGSSEYHLNSVTARTDLGPSDPLSPHRAPRGRGVLECSAAAPACSDPDALDPARPLLFYQAFAACGASGDEEGPF